MMKNMHVKKAFTLIEILVVLTVLAILVGIALPRIKGMQDQGNITKAEAELKMIQLALESYYTNQNPHAYPDPRDNAQLIKTDLSLATPKILSSILYDPFGPGGTTEYFYNRSGDGTYYCVASLGLNRSGGCKANDDGTVEKDSDDICVSNAGECTK